MESKQEFLIKNGKDLFASLFECQTFGRLTKCMIKNGKTLFGKNILEQYLRAHLMRLNIVKLGEKDGFLLYNIWLTKLIFLYWKAFTFAFIIKWKKKNISITAWIIKDLKPKIGNIVTTLIDDDILIEYIINLLYPKYNVCEFKFLSNIIVCVKPNLKNENMVIMNGLIL